MLRKQCRGEQEDHDWLKEGVATTGERAYLRTCGWRNGKGEKILGRRSNHSSANSATTRTAYLLSGTVADDAASRTADLLGGTVADNAASRTADFLSGTVASDEASGSANLFAMSHG
ncbi:hypothetical protein PSTG_15122 [Puccinia striiformis f. sp. tritici PST-78]|uniref:Uncharacterized protein n=1 Tax=Puccinia striiformis f. sp. tritici PST-78 TaxID=1165861 RepID=A0A0L0UXL9_9BASI|nr:hypothetical protein PSTG_15122 [Puccinia striiformis f. sp. tritici PST-78]